MAPLSCAPPADLRRLARAVRAQVIRRSLTANVGHIGSALSIADMLAALWGRALRNPASDDPDRDLFVLCKGHAALGLYSVMHECGLVDEASIASYCQDGSPFGAHPEMGVPGVEISTGSLGQGLSVAAGMAWAVRAHQSPARVFALLSDAECNEGQVWEAAQFAAHHRLDNLVALVDLNGMQAMGRTQEVLDLSPMSARWAAFGWHVLDIDGHDPDALADRLETIPEIDGRPTVLVAHTCIGKGVSFMEDRLEWHYRNLSADLARQALEEIEGGP